MTRIVACTTLAFVLLMAGCSGSDNIGPTNSSSGNGAPPPGAPAPTGFTALFVPLSGVLPYPNDAYFSGSNDGTLNLPPSAFSPVTFRMSDTAPAEPVMNALDGFSTTAAMSARFDGPVDPTSVTAQSVFVLQVTTDAATKGVTGFVGGLVPGTDYTAAVDPASGNTTITIRPLRPLAPKSSYLVLLTNGIKSSTGAAASADADYSTFSSTILAEFGARAPNAPPAPAQCAAVTNPTLNGLCRLTSTHFLVARGASIDPATIVLSFSFTTQSISDTLDRLNQRATAGTAVLQPGPTTAALIPGSPGLAQIYAGALQIPYYLTPASTPTDNAPLTRFWVADPAQPTLAPPGAISPASPLVTQFKPLPLLKATLSIPLLVTVPVGGCSQGGGCPVAIFQHGITRSRADSLLVADQLAGRGFATVAIDLPLHGIVPGDQFAALRRPGLTERTFDVDLVNASGAPGSDGTVDSSGTHFINLSNVLVSRDNLRQAVSDLIVLTRTIPTLDYNGDSTPDFNANRIHYVGYSLGAIVGMTFLGVNSEVRSSALPFGGVGLTAILTQSASLSPRINAGLAAVNAALQPNTPLYNTFFRDAQTASDSADPINYAARAVAASTGSRRVHMFILVGGGPNPAGGNWPADTVVPASTGQNAAALMGLPVFTSGGTVTGPGAQLRLNSGDHGSYINPTINGPVTAEMQSSIANFLLSDGTQITVTNPTLLSP